MYCNDGGNGALDAVGSVSPGHCDGHTVAICDHLGAGDGVLGQSEISDVALWGQCHDFVGRIDGRSYEEMCVGGQLASGVLVQDGLAEGYEQEGGVEKCGPGVAETCLEFNSAIVGSTYCLQFGLGQVNVLLGVNRRISEWVGTTRNET